MRMFFITGPQNTVYHNVLVESYLTFFFLLLFFSFTHLDVRVPSAGTTTLLEGHKGLTEGASRRLIMAAIMHFFLYLMMHDT